jgi:hypothetical protein
MKKTLLAFASIALVAVAFQSAAAQTQWSNTGTFWPPELQENENGNGGHGLAVDPDGKIWFQFFSATDSVEVNGVWQSTRVLYVFNDDGSAALFSPIKFLGPSCDSDTLGGFSGAGGWEGMSGRGLGTDHNGNILVSQFDVLYRINYQTGECMNKAQPFNDFVGVVASTALGRASADDNGNVYVGLVFPDAPIRQLSEDFTFVENVTDAQTQFSRSQQVAPDGTRFYETNYEDPFTIIHEKPDEFSAWDSVGTAFPGMRTESSGFHPTSGRVWVSSGNPLNLVNQCADDAVCAAAYPGIVTEWVSQSWYSFDPSDLSTPLEYFTWDNALAADETGRPRGFGFSPDGNTAYVTMFSTGAAAIQTFSPGGVAVEPVDGTLPESFALRQNYPNPFNPTTTIEFELTNASYTTLRVFDTLGRQVAELVNEPLIGGSYRVTFNAQDLSSGTYVYVLETESFRKSASMTLLR